MSGVVVPCFAGKTCSRIRRYAGFPAVTQSLTTADERARLLAALDPADGDTAWGLIDLGIGMPALGTVKLSDLAGIVGPQQRPIQRYLYFRASRPLSEYARLAQRDGSIPD